MRKVDNEKLLADYEELLKRKENIEIAKENAIAEEIAKLDELLAMPNYASIADKVRPQLESEIKAEKDAQFTDEKLGIEISALAKYIIEEDEIVEEITTETMVEESIIEQTEIIDAPQAQ